MSAWSQAVWIVKKLQSNFDFSQGLEVYTSNINSLNTRVNELNERIKQSPTRVITIVAARQGNTDTPDTDKQYKDGAIWLVV